MRVNKALTGQDQVLGESIFTSTSGFIGESIFTSTSGFIGESNMVKHR